MELENEDYLTDEERRALHSHADEQKRALVGQYLEENPGASGREVAAAVECSVDPSSVNR